MGCIFCKIVKGEIPAFKVSEDEDYLAFLSIAPIKAGHTLVIPKEHSEYLFGMEDEEIGEIMRFAKPVAQRLQKALKPQTGKVGVMVAGLEVAHTHIHLIPMDSEGDLTFANARSASKEELESVARKIQETR